MRSAAGAAERAQAGANGGADEPYQPSAGRGASVLANVPATIALYRAYRADLRGDAEQAIAHASRALAEAGEDEWMLAMLAAGRSNQAIAGELVVTLDTVKKHVGHVLGKLGAANRTQAVARARELSLIP